MTTAAVVSAVPTVTRIRRAIDPPLAFKRTDAHVPFAMRPWSHYGFARVSHESTVDTSVISSDGPFGPYRTTTTEPRTFCWETPSAVDMSEGSAAPDASPEDVPRVV